MAIDMTRPMTASSTSAGSAPMALAAMGRPSMLYGQADGDGEHHGQPERRQAVQRRRQGVHRPAQAVARAQPGGEEVVRRTAVAVLVGGAHGGVVEVQGGSQPGDAVARETVAAGDRIRELRPLVGRRGHELGPVARIALEVVNARTARRRPVLAEGLHVGAVARPGRQPGGAALDRGERVRGGQAAKLSEPSGGDRVADAPDRDVERAGAQERAGGLREDAAAEALAAADRDLGAFFAAVLLVAGVLAALFGEDKARGAQLISMVGVRCPWPSGAAAPSAPR